MLTAAGVDATYFGVTGFEALLLRPVLAATVSVTVVVAEPANV
jgi:hypothetical protein